MKGTATITFTQHGVQPPVYLVTSASHPPWELLEMDASDDKTASGDTVFVRRLLDVPEGSYQYKVRIGDSHWVIDEAKETASDDSGNRNNVVHVKPATRPEGRSDSAASIHSLPAPVKEPLPDEVENTESPLVEHKQHHVQVPSVPLPYVAVETVPDQAQPASGPEESQSLNEDASKRTADADPDIETVGLDNVESPEAKRPDPPPVPAVVVEKADLEPSFGDDFGGNATHAQKIAHDLRAADAPPDNVIVSSDAEAKSHVEPGTAEEKQAPLFDFESNLPADTEAKQDATMNTIEEESTKSSTDQTNSDAGIDTPSDSTGARDVDPTPDGRGNELDHAPLLPHESGSSDEFLGPGDAEEVDELENAPLLPHEASFSANGHVGHGNNAEDDSDTGSDDGISELERAPTLPHESSNGATRLTSLPYQRTESHEIPRSPSAVVVDGELLFPHEIATTSRTSSRSNSAMFLRQRTSSGSIPLAIPRSDEEDQDLNDPSLEPFPTTRDQILERVASIGTNMNEEALESPQDAHSPFSVRSQACESVDLARNSSHTSLVAVAEADEPEDEEDLPSPVLNMPMQDVRAEEVPNEDSLITPKVERTQEDMMSVNHQPSGSRASPKATNDDGKSKQWDSVYESIATPSKVLDPPTPPLTPKKQEEPMAKTSHPSQESPESSSAKAQRKPPSSDTASVRNARSSSPAAAVRKESFLRAFIRVLFGPIGRILDALFGGRKQAR
ncbi:hypothetical protein BS50DRAFT_480905 [Corynespora cassiicola Philippines]|uniref:Uncharacterized protein n=1 Tax=Corynespora cassiicola Philippines TaxID=1448308 RepID=A0A2T2P8I6_CORCC|nr:hypothetical protein BS50DRAFT_480905 [Corynespora cassiicola Philippines]